MCSFPFNNALRQQIETNLSGFDVETLEEQDLRHAAVSVVIAKVPATGEACVLLTLRPDHMNRHGGQFALPGGRLDRGETTTDAALREIQEELGLSFGTEDVIGTLDDYPTRSGFRITPLVIWANGSLELKPDPDEVEEVFFIPLTELDSPDIPALIESEEGEHPVLSSHIPTLGHEIYAPTAAMLFQFREIALRGQTTRVAHYDQPAFAWK